MKHLVLPAFISVNLISLSLSAYATPLNQSAITVISSTAAQAIKLQDDTSVRLTGKITKAVGDEKYQFKDATGTIVVDIDDELWQGKPLMANQTLTIQGEVDIDYLPKKRVEIDVDHVEFK